MRRRFSGFIGGLQRKNFAHILGFLIFLLICLPLYSDFIPERFTSTVLEENYVPTPGQLVVGIGQNASGQNIVYQLDIDTLSPGEFAYDVCYTYPENINNVWGSAYGIIVVGLGTCSTACGQSDICMSNTSPTVSNRVHIQKLEGLCHNTYVTGCAPALSAPAGWEFWSIAGNCCGATGGPDNDYTIGCFQYKNTNPNDEDEYITDLYFDADGDGYGTDGSHDDNHCLSNPPTSEPTWVVDGGDCNDDVRQIHPGAEEVCDGIDNDCDGHIDEGVKTTYYKDDDGDGFGDRDVTEDACSVPTGYVENDDDCNDRIYEINPNTVWCYDPDGDEVCDEPGNTKTQCSKPTNYSATYLMQNPLRVDNCPDVPNRMVWHPSPYRELFAARYDEDALEGGAENLKKGAALLGFGYFTGDRKYFVWQKDHDLDGIGDACDFENSEGEGGFFYSRIYDVKAKPVFSGLVDNYATIRVSMPSDSGEGSESCSGFDSPRCDVAVHYCAMGHRSVVEENLWGKDGYCTTTDKTDNTVYSDEFTCNFGFSHGSDNYTSESVERWSKRISRKFYNFDGLEYYLTSTSVKPNDDPARRPVYAFDHLTPHEWHWRRDWYGDNLCYDSDYSDTPICQSLRHAGDYNKEFSMYYSVSSSVFVNEDIEYMIDDGNTKKINPDYFHSSNIYSRAFRYGKGGDNTGMMTLNFFNLVPGRLIPWEELMRILKYIKYDGYSNIYLTAPLNLVLDGVRLKPDAMKNYSGRWSVDKQDGAYQLNSQKIYFSDNANTFMIGEGLNKSIYAVNEAVNSQGETVYELRMNSEDNGADWNKIGTVSNWDTDIRAIKTVIEKDDALYMIAKVGFANDLWTLLMITPPSFAPLGDFACDEPVPVYTVNEIQQSGINDTDFEDFKLISVNDSVFLVGSDDIDGSIKMFEMNENNVFTEMQINVPSPRSTLNVGQYGKYIYLVGGIGFNNENVSDLWRFDTENRIWEQIPENMEGNFGKAIIQFSDGKIVAANPIINDNTTHSAISFDPTIEDVSLITVENLDIPVTEVADAQEQNYCLNETDYIVKGGLEVSGECVPFSHPWYNSFSAGSTVYSVAGKGARLYVGTDGKISIYNISNYDEMVLITEFSTNGERVYDLEIAGSEMYAATSGGIYKFDISLPDELTLVSNYDTGYNYQYRIQLYNDLLYVGDDYGINIRDKETLSLISYVDTGAVLDFAISDGEISMYKSSFFSSMIQVRDVDSLNVKAWEYADCYTGELTSDHGEFYLSCDGYDYRFVGRPDTYIDFYSLEADILELQENYVYDGWTYIPDGSNIKLSTNNDVPSLCGNGIIEPGEVCDGDSLACTDLDSSYFGGTAYCNSTCDGYNEDSCETDDGW